MSLGEVPVIGLARWWWTFVLRGLLAIGFGVLAFLAPAWGIRVLVLLFAAWALVDGAISLLDGIRTRGQDRSWWLEIVEGLIGVGAGVVAILLPAAAELALVIVIGAWSILTGIVEIVLAVRLRRVVDGEVWMALAGAASVLFGAVLLVYPGVGALSLVWLIGAFAIVFGIFEIGLGLRLRGIGGRLEERAA